MARQGGSMGMGCIMSIVGGVVSLCITGGVIAYVFYMQSRITEQVNTAAYQYQPPGMVAAPGMPAAPTWNGVTTFDCGGVDNVTLSNQAVFLSVSPAIRAGGNCQLTLMNMNITATVAIEAGGNARVTIMGGVITGQQNSVSASGNATVTNMGATVTGPAARSGFATVTGIP